MSGTRAVRRCDILGVAPYSDSPDLLFRAWLTPAFAETQRAIAAWMAEAGMTVRLDAATNLIGRYEGLDPAAPALVIGSHIDSVRDAGRYDGPLGVMLGIECVAALAATGRRLRFPIEVYAFGDEEGSRFPAAMLTSKAVAGVLEAAALDVADSAGVTIEEALQTYSVRFERNRETSAHAPGTRFSTSLETNGFGGAKRAPHTILAYLEAHIEQGPVLEAANLAVGIVTGIAAQLRYRLTVTGTAGHAGTTTMALRRDALTAAAEMVLAAEAVARATPDVVATVGALTVAPGAANVIPGRVDFTLDVRSGDQSARDAAAQTILKRFATIATARGVALDHVRIHDLPASPCDPHLMDRLAAAVQDAGTPPFRLVSGAGHDAMVMAALCPTAMLFVRCAGGVSHNPAEAVDAADVEVALAAMLGFIDGLDADFGA